MVIARSLILVSVLVTLSACGGPAEVRKQFGLKRSAPDAFAVLKRAPLEIPPPESLDLPIPQPGAARPQEIEPYKAAKTSLFGAVEARENGDLTSAENRFLELAGTSEDDGLARSVINAETKKLHDRNKPVVEKLLGVGGNAAIPSATVVDAGAEAARIRDNIANGLSITEGETPSIEE